jgi:hypothetical protein
MPENKGLNRGGTKEQEGDLDIPGETAVPAGRRPRGSVQDRLDWRDQQKQRGGIDREQSLEEKKKKIQPTHVVD